MSSCRICGNDTGNQIHAVREMMFGMRDIFNYLECARCGCLQICAYPACLEKYYPKNYWEFESRRLESLEMDTGLSAWIRRRRTRYWFTDKPDLLGKLLALGQPIPIHITWLRRAGVTDLNVSVLDVGCGIGDRLQALHAVGLTHLEGVDPFINNDIHYPNGVRIYKKSVFEVSGTYDFITLHHSFEHMPEPLAVLRKLYERLASKGVLLLRIPVTAQAWREYGVHWVQIDAPRHFYLHTVNSMQILARQAGFQIDKIEFDSNPFQFWGSEQYRRDIPLYDPQSYEFGVAQSIFSKEKINAFTQRSHELNREGQGDQACFYLRKVQNL